MADCFKQGEECRVLIKDCDFLVRETSRKICCIEIIMLVKCTTDFSAICTKTVTAGMTCLQGNFCLMYRQKILIELKTRETAFLFKFTINTSVRLYAPYLKTGRTKLNMFSTESNI
jgi:hypothetical protein